MILDSTLPFYIMGDHHGEYHDLISILQKFNLHDCYLFHVGDGGEGFILNKEKQQRQYNYVNNFMLSHNITYLSIRGNHSDPSYFDGSVDLSHFKLLKDYTQLIYKDKKILVCGGSISVDRISRRKNVSWWKGEKINLEPEKATKCDILITHAPPSWNVYSDQKRIAYWCSLDESLWEECFEERVKVDKLIELTKPSKHFCGDFHLYSFASKDNCDSTILDILQIKELFI
jgi:UDP-2,3-diacylglucosamine pyrophosphatase LpxH